MTTDSSLVLCKSNIQIFAKCPWSYLISKDKEVKTIDDYISMYPEDVRIKLEKLRKTIKEVAPQSEEAISYRMPTFKLNGNLVYFAAFKDHISFYPTPSGIEAFEKELSKYKCSKGTVLFPTDEPIPFDLIRKIVGYRMKENLGKKKKAS